MFNMFYEMQMLKRLAPRFLKANDPLLKDDTALFGVYSGIKALMGFGKNLLPETLTRLFPAIVGLGAFMYFGKKAVQRADARANGVAEESLPKHGFEDFFGGDNPGFLPGFSGFQAKQDTNKAQPKSRPAPRPSRMPRPRPGGSGYSSA